MEYKFVWICVYGKYYPFPSSETNIKGILVENIIPCSYLDDLYCGDITPTMEYKQHNNKIILINDSKLCNIMKGIVSFKSIIMNNVSIIPNLDMFVEYISYINPTDPIIRLWYYDFFIFKMFICSDKLYCSNVKKFRNYIHPNIFYKFKNKIEEKTGTGPYYTPDPLDVNHCILSDQSIGSNECVISVGQSPQILLTPDRFLFIDLFKKYINKSSLDNISTIIKLFGYTVHNFNYKSSIEKYNHDNVNDIIFIPHMLERYLDGMKKILPTEDYLNCTKAEKKIFNPYVKQNIEKYISAVDKNIIKLEKNLKINYDIKKNLLEVNKELNI